jgi:LDH2 family malate/lactate/ureidoglycolate dehydrogenase
MPLIENPIFINIEKTRSLLVDILSELGLSRKNAETTIDILISADRRGIPSHGVARIQRYINGLKYGMMSPDAEIKILRDGPTYARIDGGAGMGQVVGEFAMNLAIKKAKENGMAFVSVLNSNHYGIAGYYSMMALDEDMIGISSTNAGPLVTPTFSRESVFGTNPLSISAPSEKYRGLVVDMATSTVTKGKLEVYNRIDKNMPLVWATDDKGKPTDNPGLVLNNLKERKMGGLLPLGGVEEKTGGHKGYCLAFIVELFTALLSGGDFAQEVYEEGHDDPSGVCHFFGCMDVEVFRPMEEFKRDMDELIEVCKNSAKAEGAERIYIPGEKEFDFEEKYTEEIPVDSITYEKIKEIAKEYNLVFDI